LGPDGIENPFVELLTVKEIKGDRILVAVKGQHCFGDPWGTDAWMNRSDFDFFKRLTEAKGFAL
jgi:hypothetical protein